MSNGTDVDPGENRRMAWKQMPYRQQNPGTQVKPSALAKPNLIQVHRDYIIKVIRKLNSVKVRHAEELAGGLYGNFVPSLQLRCKYKIIPK